MLLEVCCMRVRCVSFFCSLVCSFGLAMFCVFDSLACLFPLVRLFVFFFFFILRRMGKNKALAHHTSTYFHTCRVSI